MTADKDALRKRLRTYALNASFSVAKDLNDAADALGQKDDGCERCKRIMSAEMPEPVAHVHTVTCATDKGVRITWHKNAPFPAIGEKLYGPDFSDYALRLEAERNAVQIENESLTRQIDHVIDSANKCEIAERQLAACQKECEEQARLNGMGSEREARLMAQLAEAIKKADDADTDMLRAIGLYESCAEDRKKLQGALAELQAKHDALVKAANALLERWHTPAWKDAPATAVFINNLRAAMSAVALRDSEGGE